MTRRSASPIRKIPPCQYIPQPISDLSNLQPRRRNVSSRANGDESVNIVPATLLRGLRLGLEQAEHLARDQEASLFRLAHCYVGHQNLHLCAGLDQRPGLEESIVISRGQRGVAKTRPFA